MRSSSAGAMPSRVRKPCNAFEAALRGRPASQRRTRRRHRPRRSAAERPAGPPPRMIASQTVDSVTVRQLVHLFGEPGPGDPLGSVPTPAAPVERAAPDLDLSDPLAAVVQPEPERGPGLRELRHPEIRFDLVLTDDSSSDHA